MKSHMLRFVLSWSTAMPAAVAKSVRNGLGYSVLCALPVLLPGAAPAFPAFPGAEGCGVDAAGGRGGDLYFVTNTNDTGAGSLRNGINTASGPRTILFKVSGNIDLASNLAINKPHLTIAGQTAPGDGITLRRRTTSVQDTHDVIVRHLRCRPGDMDSSFEDDSFHVVNGTNIMVDHVSASWSVDECLSVTHSTNVTIQWCTIGESLKNSQHAKGAHGYGSLLRYGMGQLTYHHNLYQHNDSRNPRLGDRIKLDFVNNVIYNWGGTAGYSGGNGATEDAKDNPGGVFTNYLNYIGNYLVAGPSSTSPRIAFDSGATNTVIYQFNNFIDTNKNTTLDGMNIGWGMFGTPYNVAASPYPLPPVTTNTPAVAYQRVLAYVGAWQVRDEPDLRLIGTVRTHTGRLVDAVGPANQATDYVTNTINGTNYVFVRGWPTLNSTTPPADTDNDGIPDYWERALGWDPAAANNNHTNADGYTDLEWYLNWLADPHALAATGRTNSLSLRQLTGGSTNLTYTVANGSNGTVTLAGDGYTAQFVPAANFKGMASFAFNATNTTDNGGFGPVAVAVLVTNVPPGITGQPVSVTNQAGGTAVFQVAATGADLSWRWRKNGTNLNNGGNISGATSASLTLSDLAAADAADYSVVITNSEGSVTSSIAALVVVAYAPPVISDISISNGMFRMSVTGDSGPDYIVQASTNLMFWESIYTNPAPATNFIWSDAATTNFNRRFYRVLLGP
jgi:pectate lyase